MRTFERTVVWGFLFQYKNPDLASRDVAHALHHYRDLRPSLQQFCKPNIKWQGKMYSHYDCFIL